MVINIQPKMFICTVCTESVDQGMQTYECKHYFCGKHISDGTLESLPDDLFSCPVCHSPFRLEDLYNCTSDDSSSESDVSDSDSGDESGGSCDGISSLVMEEEQTEKMSSKISYTDEERTTIQLQKLSMNDSSALSKPCRLEERQKKKNGRSSLQTLTVRSNDEYFSPYSIFGGHMFLNGWKRYGYQWTSITKCLKELRCCSILPVDMKNNETHYAFVVSCLQHIHIFKNKFVPIFIFGRNDFIENTKNDEKFTSKCSNLTPFSRINCVKIVEKSIIIIDSNSNIHILEFGVGKDQLKFNKRYTYAKIEKPL
ncbi:hypothetical protein SNEBB_004002, partial [Seison nebaliae]